MPQVLEKELTKKRILLSIEFGKKIKDLAKLNFANFIIGLKNLMKDIEKNPDFTADVVFIHHTEKHYGHPPLVEKIHCIPKLAARAFITSWKDNQTKAQAQILLMGLIEFKKQCDRITEKIGKRVWSSIDPDDRFICFEKTSDEYSLFLKFIKFLTEKEITAFIAVYPFSNTTWVQKEIVDVILSEKIQNIKTKIKNHFQKINAKNAINSIANDKPYQLKETLPVSFTKEELYAFVVEGPMFEHIDMVSLEILINKTRSITLAKALLKREQFLDSYEAFMLSVKIGLLREEKKKKMLL